MLRFVVFIALFAMVVYAGFWLLDRRKGGGGSKTAKPMPRGPVGPDDDEDFLRELERRRRHSRNGSTDKGPAKNDPASNGKPGGVPPKDTQPGETPPKRGSGPRPTPEQHAEDPRAEEAQPKIRPTDGQPNDGEA